MAMSLNGVAIFPSDASKKKSKVGKSQVTANGGRTFIHRVNVSAVPIYKSAWDLQWDGVTETIRAQIEALANVATTMAYVDQHGTTYTVQTEEDAYSDSVTTISGATGLALYYRVSLAIVEA